MLIKIHKDRLELHGNGRPAAFLAAVRETAKLNGDFWEIESTDWTALARKHRPAPEKPCRDCAKQRGPRTKL